MQTATTYRRRKSWWLTVGLYSVLLGWATHYYPSWHYTPDAANGIVLQLAVASPPPPQASNNDAAPLVHRSVVAATPPPTSLPSNEAVAPPPPLLDSTAQPPPFKRLSQADTSAATPTQQPDTTQQQQPAPNTALGSTDTLSTLTQVDSSSIVVYTNTDESAHFVGGFDAMLRFIAQHAQPPANAQQAKGTVYVRCVVLPNGQLANPQVVRGVKNYPQLDSAAIAVLPLMPLWEAARIDGQAVSAYYTIPIRF